MTASAPDRLDLSTRSIAGDRIAKLREDFPEVFRDGAIDFDALKRSLGEWVDPGKERFGLNWPGKAECMRVVQQPSVGTLIPNRGESVDFDSTGNMIVEGDNLEVLKLLQKSYYGQVKLIYIDPPYNTGNEFIYSDNFTEGLQSYLRFSGQVDAAGLNVSTNPEVAGRYHTNWLAMMYPRLSLARNLLRDDGAIFVSIDDHEVHNLRALLGDIFGEENFVATIIWQKVYAPKNSARHFSEDHDYLVVYAKNAATWVPGLLPRTAEANAHYGNPDHDARGPWRADGLSARNSYSKGQYEVRSPSGRAFLPPRGRYWTVSEEKFRQMDRGGRIWWGAQGDNAPAVKRFLSEVRQGIVPQTLWFYSDVGHTQEAKKELLDFVAFEQTENVLDTVKPTRLIQRILQIATTREDRDIVLDFFAGSAATGHAVLKQNAADGGNRRFICIQLPEALPTPESSLKTITDIARERVRRAGERLAAERAGSLALDSSARLDVGFRSYKLAASNFKPWTGDPAGMDSVAEQNELFADNLLPDRSAEDILTEIMLKLGFDLTAPVERLTLGIVKKQRSQRA